MGKYALQNFFGMIPARLYAASIADVCALYTREWEFAPSGVAVRLWLLSRLIRVIQRKDIYYVSHTSIEYFLALIYIIRYIFVYIL